MNLLALDASTEFLSLALAINGELFRAEQPLPRQHARSILPMIESLLTEAECTLGQLDGIVYGQGPGSFTGLRVACSVAKGLAYAYNLPLFPVSSLAALAQSAFQKDKNLPKNSGVLAMMDARMQQVYWAYFTAPYREASAQVGGARTINLTLDTSIIVTGVGYQPYLEQLPLVLQKKIAQHFPSYPSAQAMVAFVLAARTMPLSAQDALPLYVRNQVTQGEPRG